jgi:hypothetical protein
MFEKINLFNFGSPSFVLAVAKFFKPQVALQGDTIIRIGDIAEEMFFIK